MKLTTLLFSIFLFSFASAAFTMECGGEFFLEYQEAGKMVKVQKKFCVLNENKSFITTNCFKNCQFKEAQMKKMSLPAGFGTPSHLECRKYGGLPMIVNLSGKSTKIKTVLCQFHDGSMGTPDLLGELR